MLKFTDIQKIITGGDVIGHVGKEIQGVERVTNPNDKPKMNKYFTTFIMTISRPS